MRWGYNMNRIKNLLFFLLLASSVFAQASAEVEKNIAVPAVGKVILLKGIVTANSQHRSLTALAKGADIYLHDRIETAASSFIVIRMNDGGKLTLRPETQLNINDYNDRKGQERQLFELIKGGLRAVTGAIGKVRPEAVKYRARTTTIGIRGTTIVLRFCVADECQIDDNIGGGSNSENKELILVTKDGIQKDIPREEIQRILLGLYVSVIQGLISLDNGEWKLNLGAGENCITDANAVNCFLNSQNLELNDPYLNGEEEKITLFDLFDEFNTGGPICEIQ